MIKPILMKSLLASLLLLLTFTTHANECNIMSPSFMVNGEEQWNNETATEIFSKQSKIALPKGRKGNTQGVPLKTLVEPYAKQGTLIAVACSGKSLNLNVSDLFSDDKTKSDYALILSNKGFFKIVTAEGSNPALKKIGQLKLITQN